MSTKTFIYSPDIRVYVAAGKYNMDLSDDVESFSLNRRKSAISTFSCVLNNKKNKYDGKIPRMSRIVVSLRRTEWLQVFSGYVTTVPIQTAFPTTVNIEASCTLKRLEHTYWDPYTTEAQDLLPNAHNDLKIMTPDSDDANPWNEDGGAARSMARVLDEVVGWERDRIHIQRIPRAFLDHAIEVADKLDTDEGPSEFKKEMARRLGVSLDAGGYLNGQANADAGTSATGRGEYGFIVDAAAKQGFEGEDLVNMVAIALAESGGDPEATNQNNNGTTDYGLWQINSVWEDSGFDTSRYDDPEYNAKWARSVYLQQGYEAWYVWDSSTSPLHNGSYENFLDVARQAVEWSDDLSDADSPPGWDDSVEEDKEMQMSVRSWLQNHQLEGVKEATWGMGAFVHALAGDLIDITSAYRPGATVRNTGRPSLHGDGYALDYGSVNGSITDNQAMNNPEDQRVQDMDRAWSRLLPYIEEGWFQEAIYKDQSWSPSNGSLGPYSRNDHYDHIHLGIPRGSSDFHGVTGSYEGRGPGGGEADSILIGVSGDLSVLSDADPSRSSFGSSPSQSEDFTMSPFNIVWRTPEFALETVLFRGERAFLNTEKVLETVQYLSTASLREFQSAPNGDFVAWFPDWFGIYGRTPALTLRDIEIIDLDVYASDEPLVTHFGLAGNVLAPGTGNDPFMFMMSHGIITMENENIIKILLGLDKNEEMPGLNVHEFLARFGMRPLKETVDEINNHAWEFMYGLHRFMQQWTAQFNTSVDITFMPEVYPGMQLRLEDQGFEVYVEDVSHSGSRSGGFSTTVTITAPIKRDDDGNPKIMGLELTSEDQKRHYTYTRRPRPAHGYEPFIK